MLHLSYGSSCVPSGAKAPCLIHFLLCSSLQMYVHLTQKLQALDYENKSRERGTTSQWIQQSCYSNLISLFRKKIKSGAIEEG